MLDLDLRLNARVIAATASAPVLDEMRWTGATEHGIGHMLAKGEALAVVLENVERRQANLLKQEMLAAGGDAAVSTGVCSETVAETRVVVVGSRRQFDALLDRLAEEPFDLPAVAREIAAALEGYARRRFVLRCRDRSIQVGPRPALMGIVNVTPDSFSDGGLYASPQAAIEHGLQLAAEGANVLDVGGEFERGPAAGRSMKKRNWPACCRSSRPWPRRPRRPSASTPAARPWHGRPWPPGPRSSTT